MISILERAGLVNRLKCPVIRGFSLWSCSPYKVNHPLQRFVHCSTIWKGWSIFQYFAGNLLFPSRGFKHAAWHRKLWNLATVIKRSIDAQSPPSFFVEAVFSIKYSIRIGLEVRLCWSQGRLETQRTISCSHSTAAKIEVFAVTEANVILQMHSV